MSEAAEEMSGEDLFDSVAAEMEGGEVTDAEDTVEEIQDEAALPEEQESTDEEADEPAGQEEKGETALERQEQSEENARLQKLIEENNRLQHQFRSETGRQSALQKRIKELESQLAGNQQGNQSTPEGMSDSEWDAMKEDYPDIAAAFEKRIQRELSAAFQAMEGKFYEKIQPFEQQAQQQRLDQQYAALESRHPDWQEVAKAPEFQSWLGNQPPAVQSLMASEDAADAAYLLDSFKMATGRTQADEAASSANKIREQRQARLQASATQPRRGAVPRGDLSQGEEGAAFDYFAKQIDSQRRR